MPEQDRSIFGAIAHTRGRWGRYRADVHAWQETNRQTNVDAKGRRFVRRELPDLKEGSLTLTVYPGTTVALTQAEAGETGSITVSATKAFEYYPDPSFLKRYSRPDMEGLEQQLKFLTSHRVENATALVDGQRPEATLTVPIDPDAEQYATENPCVVTVVLPLSLAELSALQINTQHDDPFDQTAAPVLLSIDQPPAISQLVLRGRISLQEYEGIPPCQLYTRGDGFTDDRPVFTPVDLPGAISV